MHSPSAIALNSSDLRDWRGKMECACHVCHISPTTIGKRCPSVVTVEHFKSLTSRVLTALAQHDDRDEPVAYAGLILRSSSLHDTLAAGIDWQRHGL